MTTNEQQNNENAELLALYPVGQRVYVTDAAEGAPGDATGVGEVLAVFEDHIDVRLTDRPGDVWSFDVEELVEKVGVASLLTREQLIARLAWVYTNDYDEVPPNAREYTEMLFGGVKGLADSSLRELQQEWDPNSTAWGVADWERIDSEYAGWAEGFPEARTVERRYLFSDDNGYAKGVVTVKLADVDPKLDPCDVAFEKIGAFLGVDPEDFERLREELFVVELHNAIPEVR